jgi:hypothetical protein
MLMSMLTRQKIGKQIVDIFGNSQKSFGAKGNALSVHDHILAQL